MVSFGDALTYPTNRADWVKTVAIGGILSFFWFLLFVPVLVVSGYIARVIGATLTGETEPPTFGDWGSLFVEGLKVFVVGLVYMIVPIAVWAVTVGGSILSMATGTEGGAAAGIGGLLVGMALYFVLSLVFGYFAAVGIVNFVREGRIGAAFDVGVLTSVGLTGEFAVAWLGAVVVYLVVGFVMTVLNVIPILGFVIAFFVGPFVYFYAAVVAARLWTEGFQDAMGEAAV